MTKEKKQTTALANWDEEMAKQAQVAADMEASTAGGQFFSLRGGQLTFNDAPLPGNQMAVVVLDSVMENVYYEGKFDPDDITGPACYAFGRDEKTIKPHTAVAEPQHETCAGCPQNEWGSADTGRGKACANRRRLALIPAGAFNTATGKFEPVLEPEHYETAQIAYLKLPVTSVKGYAAVVKQVAAALKRPPHGVFMKFKVVPDAKSQFRVLVEPLQQVPNELLGVIMARHDEAKNSIEFPYAVAEEGAADKKPVGKGNKKRKY